MSSLRESLQAVYDQRGELTPRLVVDEARDEDHPLHSRFQWDDSIAGEKWRHAQAQELIRSVRVVYRKADKGKPERSVRYWHALRQESGYAYESAEHIAADPVLTQVLLMDMRREWKSLQARYGHFDEFARMVQADLQDGAA